MKRFLPFFLIFILAGCTTTQYIKFEPINQQNIFWENDRKIAYQNNDSVIVSVAIHCFDKKAYSLETTIDNQSNHPVVFNSKEVYLFRYNSDSLLAEKKVYFATDPLSDYHNYKEIKSSEEEEVSGISLLKMVAGAAYAAAKVASIGNEAIAEGMDVITSVRDVAQQGIEDKRAKKIENLENTSDESLITYYQWNEISIEPGDFSIGNILLKVPYSEYYKVYLPINNRIYQYTFKGERVTETTLFGIKKLQ